MQDLSSSDMSLDVILSMVTEEDFRDVAFCERLIIRALQERNLKAIKSLLEKISTVFVFASEEFRKKIVECIYSGIQSSTFETILEIGNDSILGNIVAVYYFIKKVGVVTPEKTKMLARLTELKHLKEPFILEFIPTIDTLILDLDGRIKETINTTQIEKAIEICEILFKNEKLEKSKDTILGFLLLYENSQLPERKFKRDIVSALLDSKLDRFLRLVKKIYKGVKDKTDLINHYIETYDILLSVGIPVFFEFSNFRYELDKFYNGNFYFAKLLDKSGNEDLIPPFQQRDATRVQKVFDIETERFITPKGRIGKLLLRDVYSFRKAREVTEVTKEQIEFVKKLYEDDIEEKIRGILRDQNITSHSPAEKTDVYTHKLFVNGEQDLRDVGIIIKGRGYLPKVNLSDVASNILKAVDLPIQIVFLIHIGVLLDEAREKFVNQCNRAKKMYCVVDPRDLARLLLAYNIMSEYDIKDKENV